MSLPYSNMLEKELTTNTHSTNPSICIPRVFAHIPVSEIINIFQNKIKIGLVKNIDVIYNTHNDGNTKDNIVSRHKFKKVFIHFKYWNPEQDNLKSTLNEGKFIKVVYDNPWFWKCSLSRGRGHDRGR